MRILQINMQMPRIKNQTGTSLVELLVAMSLFVVIILASTQIFKMVLDGQRNAVSAQNVQENMRYAMEKISKEIRMAEKSDGACKVMFSNPEPTAVYKIFNTADNDSKLYFKNQNGNCVAYYLIDKRLMIKSGLAGTPDYITPAKIEVSNLKFKVTDDLIGAFHSLQPFVTMVMDVKAVGLAINEQEMKLQMTVSSRYYE